jgi:excisionase family DNA binding protein
MQNIDLNENKEPFTRLREISDVLGIKYETILDWTKREDFPVLRLPGALRARRSDVAKWLEQFQNPSEQKGKNE